MIETIDVRIDSVAVGGDGVGRHDGIVVFVPRTAPGDLARVRVRTAGRFMRGTLLELLEPSPHRVLPECEHYVVDQCGGCQLQHLLYEWQVDAKAGIIYDSLRRIGRLDIGKPDVVASEERWRYRRKLTLALRRQGGVWIAGLRRYDAPDAVFPVRDCPITQEQVLRDWRLVLEQQALLPKATQLRGAVRRLASGFTFTLEGGREWNTHERFFAAIPQLMELWWKPEAKPRRRLHARTATDQAGASFRQVNPGVAAALRAWVTSLATQNDPEAAIDAYAGTGDTAVELANSGIHVTAIERDRAAARVCASRLPDGSRVLAAPVEDALDKALPADVVILNPPRTGVDARVAQILNAQHAVVGPGELHRASAGGPPRAVIYVSCDPATLARDVRRMDAYRVASLRGFDMFPQTAHVETVCELVPVA